MLKIHGFSMFLAGRPETELGRILNFSIFFESSKAAELSNVIFQNS